jgi:hypothetical protein
MFKDRDDKWTRQRGFWEINGGDFLMVGVALFFLTLTVIGVYVVIAQPQIKGLHELFSDPLPSPPADQKLHLAPGEQEILLFKKPVAPPAKPAEPKK